ncbi:hypothetical protein D3C87_471770 [compost metagenome]
MPFCGAGQTLSLLNLLHIHTITPNQSGLYVICSHPILLVQNFLVQINAPVLLASYKFKVQLLIVTIQSLILVHAVQADSILTSTCYVFRCKFKSPLGIDKDKTLLDKGLIFRTATDPAQRIRRAKSTNWNLSSLCLDSVYWNKVVSSKYTKLRTTTTCDKPFKSISLRSSSAASSTEISFLA